MGNSLTSSLSPVLCVAHVITSHPTTTEPSGISGARTLDHFRSRCVVYVPTSQLQGAVTKITVCEEGTQVALTGNIGVYILYVPMVKIHAMAAPKEHLECDIWLVEPETTTLFKQFPYEVLQARWHPETPSYIVVLFNDNFIRLFNTAKKTMEKILFVGCHQYRHLSTFIHLGQLTVDFDFAPPVNEIDETSKVHVPQYPLICLTREGTIFKVYFSSKIAKGFRPFLMKDCGRNRYPKKAQSILVIHSQPPIIVVAFNNGLINHSILLNIRGRELLMEYEEIDVKIGKLPNGEAIQTPIIFIKDSSIINRYFVLHNVGINAVMLQIVSTLDVFLSRIISEKENEDYWIQNSVEKSTSELRFVFLTATTDRADMMPVFGMGSFPSSSELCHVLILNAVGCPFFLTLRFAFPQPASDRSWETETGTSTEFVDVISNNLQGNNLPLLNISERMEHSSPEKMFELVVKNLDMIKCRALNHLFVSEVIRCKVQIIKDKEVQLQEQITKLKSEKNELTTTAERVAETYEENKDRLVELQQRMEKIAMGTSESPQTLDEVKLKTVLTAAKETIETLKDSLFQAQRRFTQVKSQEHIPEMYEKPGTPIHISNEDKQPIVAQLIEMNSVILKLVEKIEYMKLMFSGEYPTAN